ncbi:hypothetical protein C8J57DRAFT_1239208 [Mycena rebaudengoi]|nr:hypothetical protein C8J57DRAFT_1239208 [Mycena rebaudengoi]
MADPRARSSMALPRKARSKAAKSSSTIDERILTVDDLPDVDETFNLELQSSLLSETYIGRPNLRQVTVYSWSDREGPDNMDATNWPDIIDNLPDEEVMMAFKFVQSGKYINPGQLDPRECNAAMPIYIKESEYRYTIRVGDATAIFVSTGMSVVSSLTKPTGAGSAAKKFLSVRPHSQEAERTIAFIGALLHQGRLYMQLDADAITYSTRSLQYSDNSLSSSSKAPMIKGIQSPARGKKTSVIPTTLSVHDTRWLARRGTISGIQETAEKKMSDEGIFVKTKSAESVNEVINRSIPIGIADIPK